MSAKLKEEIFRLLKEDLEFRYAVAGLIGLEEILRRLDSHEETIRRLWEEVAKLREEMVKGFERHDEILERHSAEIARLREDMVKGFERHDRILEKHSAEIVRLREEMAKGFERHDKILAELREDMVKGFERYDEILERHSAEIVKLRKDMLEGFRRHDELLMRHGEELARFRRHLDALGARWGLMNEEAFREGLRGVLRETGLRVERWEHFDEDGYVHGYPSMVEVDVAVVDGKPVLVEVKSHVRRSDVYELKRKAELYEKVTGRKAARLIVVSPYIEDEALEACKRLGVEPYTRV